MKTRKPHPLAKPDAPADPLLVGGSSPALERYRHARADLAEMEREEKALRMVSAERVREALVPFLHVMRGTTHRLQTRFGPEAADIFNEGLVEAERVALAALDQLCATTKPPAKPAKD